MTMVRCTLSTSISTHWCTGADTACSLSNHRWCHDNGSGLKCCRYYWVSYWWGFDSTRKWALRDARWWWAHEHGRSKNMRTFLDCWFIVRSYTAGMAFIPPRPSGWHAKKPLTKSQLRKRKKAFEDASERIAEAREREGIDSVPEKDEVAGKLKWASGWL